ncbi:MAG: hypothetical protein VW270_30905 [Candidatus Poseidoniales archaeon]|jgi:hypothetical protein
MPRITNLTDTQLARLEYAQLRIVDLVRLELPNGTVKRFTNHTSDSYSNIVDGSTNELYLAGHGYDSHSPIPLTPQVNANRIEITFSAVETDSSATEPIARTLLNNPISGGTVHIIKRVDPGLNDASDGGEFVAFKGFMDNLSYKVTNVNSTITIFCGGPFSNFDRTPIYGFTNTASQQKVFPTDTGFDFSANNVRNIRWEE